MGLPSSFPTDGSVLGIEQVLNKVKYFQQDRTFLQHLNNPISVEEVEHLLHPLAQLYALLKLVHDELIGLQFDEIICLDQYYQNLEVQVLPSEEEWFPLK